MAATDVVLELDNSLAGQFLRTLHAFVNSSVPTRDASAIKLGDKTDAYEIAEVLAKGSSVAVSSKEAAEARNWVATPVTDLAALNKTLEPLVFLLANKLSFADIALFIHLRPATKKFAAEDRLKFCNVTRYSLHLSHLLGGAVAPFVAPSEAAPATTAAAAAGKPAGGKAPAKAAEPEADIPDVARVSFLVGKIVSAEMHPSAESLYVEKIDLGESEPRVVVSGLKGKVPLESLPGKMVVCVANLKPAALRGIKSFAMVLAATGADGKVELVEPPAGAKPGDRVHPQGVNPQPDAELNPKKKIWEAVQPSLVTDEKCVATFGGVPLVCSAGPCTVPSVQKASIK